MNRIFIAATLVVMYANKCQSQDTTRVRIREFGMSVGVFKPGPYNAITDVGGVSVGQVTLVEGSEIRTGVTAVLPHQGNIFQEKVPAAVFVGNGFGKLLGSTQIDELGQLETPILLTNTLSVWSIANGVVEYMLSLPGNENVRSINPVVGETNDGWLNDIRGRSVKAEHAWKAIKDAHSGPVDEGSVGAGTGTICFGWKGGIGTSSRILPPAMGSYTIGVLVQTNFGGILDIAGVPVGKELGEYAFKDQLQYGEGSCMVVLATNAPLNASQLKRLARRAPLGLGRTGSSMGHGSGDYVIAFSTSPDVRIRAASGRVETIPRFREDDLSPLFQATVEATEEAVYNSLLKATTVKGWKEHEAKALPIDKVKELLRKYGRIPVR